MPVPLYLDDDVESRALAQGLVERGFDVLRATDAGMRGRRDVDHLAFATSLGRVVYTANRGDFLRLHAEWIADGKTHSGIVIVAQQRYSTGEQIRRLQSLMAALSPGDMSRRVEFLSNWAP